MTNQASEDIVDSILSTLGIVDRKSGNRPGQIQVVKQIIRNEKQKLLDALEAKAQEYVVIGEQLRGFPYFITVDNIKAERNKLEAEL